MLSTTCAALARGVHSSSKPGFITASRFPPQHHELPMICSDVCQETHDTLVEQLLLPLEEVSPPLPFARGRCDQNVDSLNEQTILSFLMHEVSEEG